MKLLKQIVCFLLCIAVLVGLSGCRSSDIKEDIPARKENTGSGDEGAIKDADELLQAVDPNAAECTCGQDHGEELIAIATECDCADCVENENQEDDDMLHREDAAILRVVRTQDISQSKLESIMHKYHSNEENGLPLIHVKSLDELTAIMTEIGSDTLKANCSAYNNNEFFELYDLIVIPRVTNSGSVQQSIELVPEGDKLVAVVKTEVPEFATCDMANWVLVMLVPKFETEGFSLVARAEGGSADSSEDIVRYD